MAAAALRGARALAQGSASAAAAAAAAATHVSAVAAAATDILSPWTLMETLKPPLRALDAWSGAPAGGLLNAPPTDGAGRAPPVH